MRIYCYNKEGIYTESIDMSDWTIPPAQSTTIEPPMAKNNKLRKFIEKDNKWISIDIPKEKIEKEKIEKEQQVNFDIQLHYVKSNIVDITTKQLLSMLINIDSDGKSVLEQILEKNKDEQSSKILEFIKLAKNVYKNIDNKELTGKFMEDFDV